MAQHPSWSATVSNPVSGGTITIWINAPRILHIREHALESDEQPVWRELLGQELFERFRKWKWVLGGDVTVPQAVAEHLLAALADGLANHPLVLAYTQNRDDGHPRHESWLVVTHCGLVLVIQHTEVKSIIWTAWAPIEAANEGKKRRWLGALRELVQTYTDPDTIDGRPFRVALSPDCEVPSAEPPGSRVNFRFITLKNWGLHEIEHAGEKLLIWKNPRPWPPPPDMPSVDNPLKKPKKS